MLGATGSPGVRPSIAVLPVDGPVLLKPVRFHYRGKFPFSDILIQFFYEVIAMWPDQIGRRVKLKQLENWNLKRRAFAALYDNAFGETRLELPVPIEPEAHVYHLYVVQHPERDRLRADLAARGIETAIHYPFLLHEQPLFRRDEQHALPVAEEVVSGLLSLPLYPQLQWHLKNSGQLSQKCCNLVLSWVAAPKQIYTYFRDWPTNALPGYYIAVGLSRKKGSESEN